MKEEGKTTFQDAIALSQKLATRPRPVPGVRRPPVPLGTTIRMKLLKGLCDSPSNRRHRRAGKRIIEPRPRAARSSRGACFLVPAARSNPAPLRRSASSSKSRSNVAYALRVPCPHSCGQVCRGGRKESRKSRRGQPAVFNFAIAGGRHRPAKCS
jgi:hypothetical protein